MRDAFQAIEPHIPPELRQGLSLLLSQSAVPLAALGRLETFCTRHAAEFQQIAYTQFGLQSLVAVFSSSSFLSLDLNEHPVWLLDALGPAPLPRMKTAEEVRSELGECAFHPIALAGFRRKQILRILLRDVLGFAALSETIEELSILADTLLDGAYHHLKAELGLRHGVPRLANGEECGFSVLALGKLGGEELNYSSDIDLMFVYDGPGRTDGPAPLSNSEFYHKLATQLAHLLGTYTPAGITYRVDLRLRPDGRQGEPALPLAAARAYYEKRARDWELQMLIKARVAAGDPAPGRSLLDGVQPLIYASSLDFPAIERMTETRERLNEKLGARRPGAGIDVKLNRGGIRDIEFLVQCLQRLHGGRDAWVRNSSTLLALLRLRDKDFLSDTEYSRLASAYQFFRHLEHRLQFDEDRQTHTLPTQPDELAVVARRMPAGLLPAPEALLETLEGHFARVGEIYERLIRADQAPAAVEPAPTRRAEPEPPAAPRSSNLMRFLAQRAPSLAASVARASLGHSQSAFEHFLEQVVQRDDWLDALDADGVLSGYVLDIFAHSPYFAEQLMRQPEFFEEIRVMRTRGASSTAFGEVLPLLDDAVEIRRYFLRQMFRLQAESLCLQHPVFTTLQRISELADAAIVACYRVAVAQTAQTHAPATPGYVPAQQMMVVALGRLGLAEFDLGSDADLIFVIPDADLPELHFWTRAAERLVAILGSYTGDGIMFTVDARLCPNGKGGALVQSEGAYRDYFARTAEAWEGLAYMKSRAIAGDLEQATRLLADLQKIDWRRYGQSGRSRAQLRHMRLRIEKELGESNPLKTAAGGYYDIDFALMYLRLRGAGLFYKVLNTPARIDVVEQMGHLDAADARFLLDAATFYRAVDHGLRLISGHTEGSLPASEWQLRMLSNLVERWVAPHLCDQPLPEEFEQIRVRTREYFDSLFSA
jgi:glutamate-ammonia-ligase adenylyltransferase